MLVYQRVHVLLSFRYMGFQKIDNGYMMGISYDRYERGMTIPELMVIYTM